MIRIDLLREHSQCLAKAGDLLRQTSNAPIACCRYTKSKLNITNRGMIPSWFDQRRDSFRSLIKRVVRDVLRLQPADRAKFCDSPGELCEAAGLRRCGLLGFFTELSPINLDLLKKWPGPVAGTGRRLGRDKDPMSRLASLSTSEWYFRVARRRRNEELCPKEVRPA